MIVIVETIYANSRDSELDAVETGKPARRYLCLKPSLPNAISA